MQTRREFLVTAGLALGGWFVGADLAKRILRRAREDRAPYLIKVPAPERILWANPNGYGEERNDYSLAQWPTARAYDYLAELDLQDHPQAGPDPLGTLEFIDGCCPGNDTCLVQARGVETLGGLQQRLFQLGQDVAIRLNKQAL